MNNVEGKVVIITGASSGIGDQTARSLVAEGARVVLSARREDRLAALAAELGEDNAAYLASDVSKLEDMQALVALAKERFGRVDVLFANAGIMPAGPMSAMDYTGWMAQVDVNVKGVLNAMAAVLPDFTGQGAATSSRPRRSPAPRSCRTTPSTAAPSTSCARCSRPSVPSP